jgi:hypothetical protein
MSKGALSLYLKRAGVITGPCLSKCTRHSDLSIYKSWICGITVSFGYKAHNNFGRAVHELFLLSRPGKYKLTPDEVRHRKGMVEALNRHPVVKKLMSLCDVREKRRPCTLNGVKLKFTPDAHGSRIKVMVDLKTTVCANYKSFLKSCFEYGYFRQGRTYGTALGIKEYWIIGIQKQPPYQVYLVLITDHKELIHYVDRELQFLLYFYRYYGKPKFKKRKKSS